jgi:hypothetical protein
MFELIVLRGEKSRAVLNREAETMNQLMRETDAPCWERSSQWRRVPSAVAEDWP